MSETLEESSVGAFECWYEQRSIQIAIAPLARGLRHQTARMTGGTMQGPVLLRIMLRTEWVRGADLRTIQCLFKQAAKIFWFAKINEAAQRTV
ncbi:hypothetical protein D3C72_2306430 [compost metagenome]